MLEYSSPSSPIVEHDMEVDSKKDEALSKTYDADQQSNLTDDTHEDLYNADQIDPVYRAKAHLLNKAMREIGMGRYQWCLFVLAGFGWFADSVWPVLTGLILTPTVNEFGFRAPFLSLAANIGFLVGAAFWGLGCDIWGRRWSFNLTLLISGVFGIAAGGSNNFLALASLLAVLGTGVGGNLPVDSAVFLEFIPSTHQYLLTVLSIWWALGQFLASLIAWPLIANFSCASAADCPSSQNKGWRYLLFILGAIMLFFWALRLFIFRLQESPRFLVARGMDAEAVAVIQRVAAFNGKDCSLTVDQLIAAGKRELISQPLKGAAGMSYSVAAVKSIETTWLHVKALFKTPKMAWSTSLLILLWGLIGLASTLYNSFLPYILSARGNVYGDGSVDITYRNQVILSLTGIPGAFLAGWAVDLPLLGRRGTLMIAACATAVFLFATTTSKSSNALLGWNCAYSFCSNIMYGVLYAISPEIFPAKDRGTGNGLTSIATRVFGVLAPIIALYANLQTAVPVYIAGALIIGAGALALLLPFEPRGKSSL